MVTTETDREVTAWLTERGHSPEEIEKILQQLHQYDVRIIRKSVFDSMHSGEFDIESIVKEALGEGRSQ